MQRRASCEDLWGTGSRRLYWWHLPVKPGKTASLGRDLLVNLIVWMASVLVVLLVIDRFLAASG